MPVCSVCRRESPYSNGLDMGDALLCSPACLRGWVSQQSRPEKIAIKFDVQHRMAIVVLMGKDWVRRAEHHT